MLSKNIAMISVDDLINVVRYRDAFGPDMVTPNIDRLMSMGTYFNQANATVPACNPSRASAMTSTTPFFNGVFKNADDWIANIAAEHTMPAALMEQGYTSLGIGKIFHKFPHADRDDGAARYLRSIFDVYKDGEGEAWSGTVRSISQAIGPSSIPEEDSFDAISITHASHFLRNHKDSDAPWYIALGLLKPHLNWNVPRKYYNLYDIDDIVIPEIDHNTDDVPFFYQQFMKRHEVTHATVTDLGIWKQAIQAYLASVSYADAQIGKFLNVMDETGAWTDTTLVLWSDHGYHLGDKAAWGKFTHWEAAANAPLIIVDTDQVPAGKVIDTPVSLLDMLPTTFELAGVNDHYAHIRQGESLVDLMNGGKASGAALTIQDGSISIRNESYRFILSLDNGEQLYDMGQDPDQIVNVADKHRALVAEFREIAEEMMATYGASAEFSETVLKVPNRDENDIVWVTDNLAAAFGRMGDDVYHVHDPAKIVEWRDGGTDKAYIYAPEAGAHFKLPKNVENVEIIYALALTERRGVRVEGSSSDEAISGTGANDKLNGNQGNDNLEGNNGNDFLTGGSGKDLLCGEKGDDRLRGGEGSDRLIGGKGDDHISGGKGCDMLNGGSGNDRLNGGKGADVFVMSSGSDVIFDLDPSEGDRLDISMFSGIGSLEDLLVIREIEARSLTIRLNEHDSVRLLDVGFGDLEADWLMF